MDSDRTKTVASVISMLAEMAFDVVCYGTGKAFAFLLMPHVGVEPLERHRSASGWRWRGFTYRRGKQRYLYTESIQLLGAAIWLIVGFAVFAIVR